MKRNETFERVHGMNNTRLNCEVARLERVYGNCSMAEYLKIPSRLRTFKYEYV